jgi:transcriptional regulator with XRE-family HTH domain
MNILRLKEILREKDIYGKELANKVGVSQNTISNIANGMNFQKPTLLIAMAKVLDVDVRELFIRTKSRDLDDPGEVIKEIKRIVEQVDVNR